MFLLDDLLFISWFLTNNAKIIIGNVKDRLRIIIQNPEIRLLNKLKVDLSKIDIINLAIGACSEVVLNW